MVNGGMSNIVGEDSDAAQERYAQNGFVGVGRGQGHAECKDNAMEDAWEKAKRAGKEGRPLRVQEEWVSGNNPITWCKVVLSDDG
ncbi:hypothetical protein BH20ACT14_BH20ACT14_05150 [soil metagenome]